MREQITYTQEQLDIALLKNTQEGILRTIVTLEENIRAQINELKADIKNQGQTHLNLILGIYAIIGAASIAKIWSVM